MQPLFNNVLIEVHKSNFTASEQADDKEALIERATVKAIGPDVTAVKIGDVILFKDFETDIITIDGEKYWLIPEESIKGICTDATTKQ